MSGRPVTAADGAIYVVGEMANGPNGGSDVLILKFNEAGNLLWSSTWGGGADDRAFGVATTNGRVYVVGETASFGAGGFDAAILEVDGGSGAILSTTFYGGAQDDTAQAAT
ncbi:MAG: hypothetical protein C4321_10105, partial [Chloroflexota bacterium]